MISRGKMGNWEHNLNVRQESTIDWMTRFHISLQIIWKELWLRVYIEHKKKQQANDETNNICCDRTLAFAV